MIRRIACPHFFVLQGYVVIELCGNTGLLLRYTVHIGVRFLPIQDRAVLIRYFIDFKLSAKNYLSMLLPLRLPLFLISTLLFIDVERFYPRVSLLSVTWYSTHTVASQFSLWYLCSFCPFCVHDLHGPFFISHVYVLLILGEDGGECLHGEGPFGQI